MESCEMRLWIANLILMFRFVDYKDLFDNLESRHYKLKANIINAMNENTDEVNKKMHQPDIESGYKMKGYINLTIDPKDNDYCVPVTECNKWDFHNKFIYQLYIREEFYNNPKYALSIEDTHALECKNKEAGSKAYKTVLNEYHKYLLILFQNKLKILIYMIVMMIQMVLGLVQYLL